MHLHSRALEEGEPVDVEAQPDIAAFGHFRPWPSSAKPVISVQAWTPTCWASRGLVD